MTAWTFPATTELFREDHAEGEEPPQVLWSPQRQMMGRKGHCHETQAKQGPASFSSAAFWLCQLGKST